jgi:spore coat polysaccharide biosynthesis predicted glycosyltransferase SpsG
LAPAASVAVRVDAGPEIGFGHLARTLVLAEALRARGVGVRFLLSGMCADIRDLVGRSGFDVSAADRIAPDLGLREAAVRTVLYDLVHTRWRADKDALYAEIAALGRAGLRIVFIDGYGEESYRCQPDAPRVDVVVAPYVGEPGPCRIRAGRVLAGPRYFPLAEAYRTAGRRGVGKTVERVLVTCGGADPHAATPRIFDALLAVPQPGFGIDIVIGALFADETRQRVEAIAARAPGRVRLLDAPGSLAAPMAEADLCVCANGLTKYELAAMGVPTIALSLSPAHHRANMAFAETGALTVLGLLDEIDARGIAAGVSALIGDAARRARMLRAGTALVDGNGTQRILEEAGLMPC